MIDQLREGFESSFATASSVLEKFRSDKQTMDNLARLAEMLKASFEQGGKVMIAGNGGSMSDAIHFAEEWTGRFRKERRPFPALVLGADPAHLTCVGNDYGFDEVFARSVSAFAGEKDLLILLSTSGNSENLIRAASAAQQVKIPIIGFLGKGGGRLLSMCDLVVMAPGETSDRIQELHMLALHTLIEVVEVAMGVS